LCSDCYKQWKKAKAAEKRALKPPNDNMEIAKGLIVTRNIRNRLEKQAQSEVPHSKRWHYANQLNGIGFFLPLIIAGVMYLLGIPLPYKEWIFWIVCLAIGIGIGSIAGSIETKEWAQRRPKVSAHMEQLARNRQQRIDEANMFYASPEWRLVRDRVVQEQGRICQECGREIIDDFDLTVDHIKPRSKFPKLALDASNLHVLCRSCNSTKGASYDESDTIPEIVNGGLP
jgi:5-methylcytosine-specific restriction endonuclease McrA